MEDDEIFNRSGPFYLTSVNWENPNHIRIILASLIQGVKIQQLDRQSPETQAQAPPWWEFFNFRLNCPPLIDKDDSIIGAIYELKSPTSNSPKYVIAFRGTRLKKGTLLRDLKVNLKCILNILHKDPRFELAMGAVKQTVSQYGAKNVWLTGYSQGAAIALLAGKEMVKIGHPIETYLFNPPFLSVATAIERFIHDVELKQLIHSTRIRVKDRIARAIMDACDSDEEFARLSSWTPNLFVNRDDPICSPYIAYFEALKTVDGLGAGNIGRLGTQTSIMGLILRAIGKNDREPLHLIPSANVTINLAHFPGRRSAHQIKQWWEPNFKGEPIQHKFFG